MNFRSFVGWLLALCLAWEILVRPFVATYWPDALLPPSMLREVLAILPGIMMGVL